MKLKEDFVLFGNAKDFESDEIFDFIILCAKLYKSIMENKHLLFHIFQKQLTTRHEKEEYLSYVNMEHDSFWSKWLCYYIIMSFVQNEG